MGPAGFSLLVMEEAGQRVLAMDAEGAWSAWKMWGNICVSKPVLSESLSEHDFSFLCSLQLGRL